MKWYLDFMNLKTTLNRQSSWDSLLTRVSILVLCVGVLTFLLHMTVVYLIVTSLLKDVAPAIATSIRHEITLLKNADPQSRLMTAAELTRSGHIVEVDSGIIEADEQPPPSIPGQEVSKMMSDILGNDVTQTVRGGSRFVTGDQIVFRFHIDGERWRILHSVASPMWATLGTALGWPTLVAFSVILTTLVGARWIGQPLSNLIGQLQERHESLKQLEVPANATREIRELVSAFNLLFAASRRAEEIKHQLLAGVSHDLRTPLTRLRMRVEMQCDPQTAERLISDLKSVDRIVNQFLGYVQGDTQTYQGELWSVAEVMKWVAEFYKNQGVPIDWSVQTADILQPDLAVQRALTNLIDNAIAHGAPPVELTLTSELAEEPTVTSLTVWDHGDGMTPADFERAKQPFVRLRNDNAFSGHCGLGLAIVQQMADATGAKISLRCDGKGRNGISISWVNTAK
jgi:two-component system osmolarity sensor histidine kinase EnvZ